MGYRSDVTIVCGKRAYEMLHEAYSKQDFLPEVKTEGEFQRLCWEFVKWYAYKQFIFGEDERDIETRCNVAGDNKLCSYYVNREVVCSSDITE